ncbi:EexN family lipoprotein [Bartonella grahamii]|uniref:EexN family lipoprotein n=1 Tax=Bartonella grahamii TaxID=33045 RepID=UPI002E7BC3AD|nr:EexN family lipoprotein [Bartonella grahamii]
MGCEKIYSVEDFKKDAKLREEWGKKCFLSGQAVKESKNCQNVLQADTEMFFSPKLFYRSWSRVLTVMHLNSKV